MFSCHGIHGFWERRVRPWPQVSSFLMENLSGAILGDSELEADPPAVLKRACAECDAAVVAEHPGGQHPLAGNRNPGPGSTAIVVLLLPPRMFVANVGDSRAIAADAEGEIVFQSVDQRPDRPEERARILRLGGRALHSYTFQLSVRTFDRKHLMISRFH